MESAQAATKNIAYRATEASMPHLRTAFRARATGFVAGQFALVLAAMLSEIDREILKYWDKNAATTTT
jgi:hypothetical protein